MMTHFIRPIARMIVLLSVSITLSASTTEELALKIQEECPPWMAEAIAKDLSFYKGFGTGSV